MSEEADSSTTFLRQRRDLFVISAILLLIPIAEIEGAGNITMPFVGVSMYIGKPEVITYSLWILWAYWYWRYFQAYKKISRNLFKERIVIAVRANSNKLFIKMAEGRNQKILKYVEDTYNFSKDEHGVRRPDVEQEEFKFFSATYSWRPTVYRIETNSNSGAFIDKENLIIKGSQLIWIRMKVLLMVTFAGDEFTEYWLPFIFGLLPAIYWLYTN